MLKFTKLSKPYIEVDGSFGGNQGWFGDITRKWKGNAITGFGCGLIGAADVLYYITGGLFLYPPGTVSAKLQGGKQQGTASPNFISKEDYMNYIQFIERRYFHILPKLGISGVLLSLGFNLYFFLNRKKIKKQTGSRFKAKWAVPSGKLLDRIREMISQDMPVIISIGPGFFHKNKLKFYRLEERDGKMHFRHVTDTKDHYVTVTGIVESSKEDVASGDVKMDENGIVLLEISSWGKKYYVNYSEYIDFVKKNDNFYFSNILYIKKR